MVDSEAIVQPRQQQVPPVGGISQGGIPRESGTFAPSSSSRRRGDIMKAKNLPKKS